MEEKASSKGAGGGGGRAPPAAAAPGLALVRIDGGGASTSSTSGGGGGGHHHHRSRGSVRPVLSALLYMALGGAIAVTVNTMMTGSLGGGAAAFSAGGSFSGGGGGGGGVRAGSSINLSPWRAGGGGGSSAPAAAAGAAVDARDPIAPPQPASAATVAAMQAAARVHAAAGAHEAAVEAAQRAAPSFCDDSCPTAKDGVCDDGRHYPNMTAGRETYVACDLGTDCSDCGPWRGVQNSSAWCAPLVSFLAALLWLRPRLGVAVCECDPAVPCPNPRTCCATPLTPPLTTQKPNPQDRARRADRLPARARHPGAQPQDRAHAALLVRVHRPRPRRRRVGVGLGGGRCRGEHLAREWWCSLVEHGGGVGGGGGEEGEAGKCDRLRK